MRQIDDSVGRILERVDLSDSVVFFTSDHGDYAGNRGLLRKIPWIPYDDLARVPLVAAGRDVAGGRRSGQLVQSCDIPLTLLDYAGVTPPPGVDFGSAACVRCSKTERTPTPATRGVLRNERRIVDGATGPAQVRLDAGLGRRRVVRRDA